MKRSILLFPKLKNMDQIQKIRMKYDPLAECIDPHITLVFPFDLNISTKELIEHVEESLTGYIRRDNRNSRLLSLSKC